MKKRELTDSTKPDLERIGCSSKHANQPSPFQYIFRTQQPRQCDASSFIVRGEQDTAKGGTDLRVLHEGGERVLLRILRSDVDK